ncbi:UNVERIFIED_CONTAM: Ferredoxin-dependent glutamate synthase, chloroplastic [Sesamum radiatum]|uniref:glutamate synthase (ferredoxin) n=1 Tax=Sesamum radiatum TaxID=300843 RepID=A0AAW2NBI1_SESRA
MEIPKYAKPSWKIVHLYLLYCDLESLETIDFERSASPEFPSFLFFWGRLRSVELVANLEDIISERGACGVGFIANLDNKASHGIVKDALTALGCMEHRGGCGADNDSGDGSGVMTSIPWDLFNEWASEQGIGAFDQLHTGVGMVFLPKNEDLMKQAQAGQLIGRRFEVTFLLLAPGDGESALRKATLWHVNLFAVLYAYAAILDIFKKEGLEVLGWRSVPVDMSVVGYYARETMPNIQQVFVQIAKEENIDDIERELYICRKLIERAASSETWGNEVYFCSLSNQTIVYKGMLRSEVLGRFYFDLQNELYNSPFAIYHRRYSTNTSPRWPLAQPMRFLGHNGEINTIQGNLNWMQSRETSLKSPVWRGRENEIRPFGNPKASDSANLDSAAELLIRSGRTPEEALMLLVPEAYKNHPTLMIKYPEILDFYDYYKGQMEAWDGPALLLFSDGKTVGACLDRNGLRPARYWRTVDNVVYVASEVFENTEVKKRVALLNPYGKWVKENLRSLKATNFLSATLMDNEIILKRQQAYGYSSEDVQMVIEAMAAQGKEPTFCMGDDIPLAVLSRRPHMLYDYFKQRFAQVTNPAIDPLREGLVMSLEVNLGKRGNILEVGPENASQEATRPAIPILLAVGAVHQHLIQNGLRMQASIVADTAQCFSTHQFACLIGYGASAICPYLALETCRQWRLSTKTVNLMRNGKMPTVTVEQAQKNFCKAVKSGLLKILSKMGISLLSSWLGRLYRFGLRLSQKILLKDLKILGSFNLGQEVLRDLLELKSDRSPIPVGRVEPASSIVERFCTGGMSLGAISRETHEAIAIAMNRLGGKSNSGEGGEVASGRFGVTPTFLANADQLEIKIAQGAKPGEGGQLPGKKVSAYIARLRNSKPGVPLISPPPHHDIYSIEDLAQLIYDLHQISGHDGGTGASPVSSIKHAGGPWELGLTETHQTLIANGLRERVILRVDGGFKSGFDVIMAALMGADEYGFGSVAMIATGCVMARICHTNNCPVGVASQVRGMLAQLGYEKLDDVIGHTELLKRRDISLVKTQHLDLSYILSIVKAIDNETVVNKSVNIFNVDRAVCGRIAGVIAKRYGDTGFAGQLNITFLGSAGQSFACFLTPGMNIRLVGEANDYVGKGMAGGELVVTPVEKTGFTPEDATIVGNTCLYGATGGQVFVRGKAGERFAVRNSLAEAVVEGTGDHCCEYMTGGCVVILGKVGRNVAAGMTGGLAYILDEDDTLIPKEKTGSSKGAEILKEWDKYLSLFWQLVPPSEEDTPEACADYEQTTSGQVTFQSA